MLEAVMKNYIVLLLVFTCQYSISNEATNKTDSEIEELLIGRWFISTEDGPAKIRTISNYKNDNSMTLLGYSDPYCSEEIIKVTSEWKVENKQLINIAITSSNSQLLPVGLIAKDTILSINEVNKILLSENDNVKQFRTKEDTCLIKLI
jgi:hypothetical protein